MSGDKWSRLKLGAVTLMLAFVTACASGQKGGAMPDDYGPPPEPGDKTEDVSKPGAHDYYEEEVKGFGPSTVPGGKDVQVEEEKVPSID